MKETNNNKINHKAYKQILRKKKSDFMVTRREELISPRKNNPKLFWQKLQSRNKQTENTITAS